HFSACKFRPWNMHDEHLVERQAGPPPYQLHWCVPGRQLLSPKLPVDISCVFQDFIFNNGGLSVAFIFETNWDCGNGAAVFSRVNALKRQYKNLYVFVAVPTVEQIKSFNQSYFKYGMELGCPTFVPIAVQDIYWSSTGLVC
ncbi:protein PARTING DANCERS homolog, partial [Hordeum vulgare subsp. vulgare]|uniref:protein PARTING DANCERS homolog n=1 Tax=Hordeum vulgare subsp. vulgare TaxID=112509 RepID=UPI001D1A59ED